MGMRGFEFLTTLREYLTRITIQKKTSYTHLRRHLESPISHEASKVLNFRNDDAPLGVYASWYQLSEIQVQAVHSSHLQDREV